MKKLNLLSLAVVVTLVFTSCSSNEGLELANPSSDLLKSYTLKRDATGAYSLDFDLNDKTKTDYVKDEKTNTNQIYLYTSDNQETQKVTQDLFIDGELLKVGFIDTKSNKSSNVTILDTNSSFSRNSDDEMLEEYSITSNFDGTFNLDFKVDQNVTVDFIYNQEDSAYEIHLEDGASDLRDFSRVLEKEDGKPLKFDFVNHFSANSSSRSSLLETILKRPRVIIDQID
ncbi:hypothetical protein MC378_07745 [Polaribacter sp. MSW13]|uniref:Lipoprotein n=1 Tax=Polaribacter marinus TaxID=2916838 RepID=A0A9X1VMW7_9FLAO|nr:hypothetical protein [Polaribacter marinus]MCI2229056.1 hypothetical protein [Polaribacter marinus]